MRTAIGSRDSASGETCNKAVHHSVQLSKERGHLLLIPNHMVVRKEAMHDVVIAKAMCAFFLTTASFH
jgi:hypothetical protein